MKVCKHLTVHGRVQGVGFRYYMIHKAREHGVTGWVRNRHEGTVEAMVQGPAEAVEAMIACAKRGPSQARVTRVEVSEGSGDYLDFDALPTG